MTAPAGGIPCMLMRGGTSKRGLFPGIGPARRSRERDVLLARIVGSPDPHAAGRHRRWSPADQQGRHRGSARATRRRRGLPVPPGRPETAACLRPTRPAATSWPAVGPFAIERGLVEPAGTKPVRIRMGTRAAWRSRRVQRPAAVVDYAVAPSIWAYRAGGDGAARVRGHRGLHAGRLLPTGAVREAIDGVEVTCVDNGMPVVVVGADRPRHRAVTRRRSSSRPMRHWRRLIRALRLEAGRRMGLGDVEHRTIPKVSIVRAATAGRARHADLHPAPLPHGHRGPGRRVGGDRRGPARHGRGTIVHRRRRPSCREAGAPTGFARCAGDLRQDRTARTWSAVVRSADAVRRCRRSHGTRERVPLERVRDIAHVGPVELRTPSPGRHDPVLRRGARAPGRGSLGGPRAAPYLGRLRAREPRVLGCGTSGIGRTFLRARPTARSSAASPRSIAAGLGGVLAADRGRAGPDVPVPRSRRASDGHLLGRGWFRRRRGPASRRSRTRRPGSPAAAPTSGAWTT